MALNVDALNEYWANNPNALAEAFKANPEAFGATQSPEPERALTLGGPPAGAAPRTDTPSWETNRDFMLGLDDPNEGQQAWVDRYIASNSPTTKSDMLTKDAFDELVTPAEVEPFGDLIEWRDLETEMTVGSEGYTPADWDANGLDTSNMTPEQMAYINEVYDAGGFTGGATPTSEELNTEYDTRIEQWGADARTYGVDNLSPQQQIQLSWIDVVEGNKTEEEHAEYANGVLDDNNMVTGYQSRGENHTPILMDYSITPDQLSGSNSPDPTYRQTVSLGRQNVTSNVKTDGFATMVNMVGSFFAPFTMGLSSAIGKGILLASGRDLDWDDALDVAKSYVLSRVGGWTEAAGAAGETAEGVNALATVTDVSNKIEQATTLDQLYEIADGMKDFIDLGNVNKPDYQAEIDATVKSDLEKIQDNYDPDKYDDQGGSNAAVDPVGASEAKLESIYNQDGTINQEALDAYLKEQGIDNDITQLPGLVVEGDGGGGAGSPAEQAEQEAEAAAKAKAEAEAEAAKGDPGTVTDTEGGFDGDVEGGTWKNGIPDGNIQVDPTETRTPDNYKDVTRESGEEGRIYDWEHVNPDGSVVRGRTVGNVDGKPVHESWEVDAATIDPEVPPTTDLPAGYTWEVKDGEWELQKDGKPVLKPDWAPGDGIDASTPDSGTGGSLVLGADPAAVAATEAAAAAAANTGDTGDTNTGDTGDTGAGNTGDETTTTTPDGGGGGTTTVPGDPGPGTGTGDTGTGTNGKDGKDGKDANMTRQRAGLVDTLNGIAAALR
jgi:hypothetical protein